MITNRVDDFTLSKLKSRIRLERNNTHFEGSVTSNKAPLNGTKLELRRLTSGRIRVGQSKANGIFEITSMEVGDYAVTVSGSGKTSIVNKITIFTGKPLSMDCDLM